MPSLKVFSREGNYFAYVGRLVLDGHEIHAEPVKGWEIGLERLRDDVATTANGSYTKDDGDKFLRAMVNQSNAHLDLEYDADEAEWDEPSSESTRMPEILIDLAKRQQPEKHAMAGTPNFMPEPVEPYQEGRHDELMQLLRMWGRDDPRTKHYAASLMELFKSRPQLRERYSPEDIAYVQSVPFAMKYDPRRYAAEEAPEMPKASALATSKPPKVHVTETPELKAWHAGSKVVDETGKPLVVYHGGKLGIDSFLPGRHAHWAHPNPDVAQTYADQREKNDQEILPLYLNIKNPMDLRHRGTLNGHHLVSEIEEAKAKGHDGLIHFDTDQGNTPQEEPSYVFFHPSQAKLAHTDVLKHWDTPVRQGGNRGTFDPNDPRIAYEHPDDPTRYEFDESQVNRNPDGTFAEQAFASKSEVKTARKKLESGDLKVTTGEAASAATGKPIKRYVELPNGAKIHPDELHRIKFDEDGALVGGLATISGAHGYSVTLPGKEWKKIAASGKTFAEWHDDLTPEDRESHKNATEDAPAASSVGSAKDTDEFFAGRDAGQGRLFERMYDPRKFAAGETPEVSKAPTTPTKSFLDFGSPKLGKAHIEIPKPGRWPTPHGAISALASMKHLDRRHEPEIARAKDGQWGIKAYRPDASGVLPERPMTDHSSWLAAIRNAPHDPDIHSIYADWLEENGDIERSAMHRDIAKALSPKLALSRDGEPLRYNGPDAAPAQPAPHTLPSKASVSLFHGHEHDPQIRDHLPTPQHAAHFTGAPDDAAVKVVPNNNGVEIHVRHPDIEDAMNVLLKKSLPMFGGKKSAHLEELFLHDHAKGSGRGLAIFAKMAHHLAEAGYGKITMHAAKDNPRDEANPHAGFYVWPAYGADGPLSDSNVFEKDAPKVQEARQKFGVETIRDLFDQPGGREWWKANGVDLKNVVFDLQKGSESHKILSSQIAKKLRY